MKKLLKKRRRSEIADLTVIKKQYKAGISILALSDYWDIPYATLYRALKQKKLTSTRTSSSKK